MAGGFDIGFGKIAETRLCWRKVAEWLYAIGKVKTVREVVRKSVGEMTLNHIHYALEMGIKM